MTKFCILSCGKFLFSLDFCQVSGYLPLQVNYCFSSFALAGDNFFKKEKDNSARRVLLVISFSGSDLETFHMGFLFVFTPCAFLTGPVLYQPPRSLIYI